MPTKTKEKLEPELTKDGLMKELDELGIEYGKDDTKAELKKLLKKSLEKKEPKEDEPKGKTFGYAVFEENGKYINTYSGEEESKEKAESLAEKAGGRKVKAITEKEFEKLEKEKEERISEEEKKKTDLFKKGRLPVTYK